jgi:hypothetical protein
MTLRVDFTGVGQVHACIVRPNGGEGTNLKNIPISNRIFKSTPHFETFCDIPALNKDY